MNERVLSNGYYWKFTRSEGWLCVSPDLQDCWAISLIRMKLLVILSIHVKAALVTGFPGLNDRSFLSCPRRQIVDCKFLH